MSNLHTKPGMTAYQRWEMTSFNEPALKIPEPLNEPEIALPPQVASISEQELAEIREQAERDGYATGYAEAYAKGLSDGQAQGLADTLEKNEQQLARLEDLINQFEEELSQSSKQLGQQILDLALDLAHTLVHKQLELDKTAILPIVEDAIDQLIQVKQPAHLFLNPLDADTVQTHLGEKLNKKGWQIIADPHIEAGGCLLESASNVIDAGLSLRWQRITEHLQLANEQNG